MPFDKRNTRLVETVKVRDSGGRSLEVTIPKSVVEAMGLTENDKLIVLEDKKYNSFIVYLDPKKASLIDKSQEEWPLYFPFSKKELEKIVKSSKED